jgi:transcriptional regulator of aromatic amino acid metabolism
MLISVNHNLLLEGPDASTDTAVLRLEPHLRKPVLWKRRGAPLEFPDEAVGTVILEDVGGLAVDDQARLLRWLDDTVPRSRIVSTTADSLFPLVARGLFDAALYYRLNVMLVQID